MTIEEFDKSLITWKHDLSKFIDSYILKETPAVFQGNEIAYTKFRRRIAKKFNIDVSDITVVGSARLGFSYTKQTPFSFDSDIDVAIVSEQLFDEYSRIICRYHFDVIRHVVPIQGSDRSNYYAFLKYFCRRLATARQRDYYHEPTPEEHRLVEVF